MSSKNWLNPPRGAGIRWVEPNINPTAYYKWGNYKQRNWRFPCNTSTDLHPLGKHWMMDYSYGKGIVVHQNSGFRMNTGFIRRPFTKQWAEAIWYKQIWGKLPALPWIAFLYGCFCCGMRAYDNSAYDYFYFTD